MKKPLFILFVVVAVATILEYLLVCGMFTGPVMMVLMLLIGLANALSALRGRDRRLALLFLLATVGLCMGYWKLMFF